MRSTGFVRPSIAGGGATKRGFSGGSPDEDWHQAETEIERVRRVHPFPVSGLQGFGRSVPMAMVDAARKLGFAYIGISDHSKSAYYAGGLKKDDLERQWELIDGLNEKLDGFRIFKGIESDILPDGSLDYDEDILRCFDFVIASVHSSFKLKGDDQLARVIKAMDNPHMTMLGHPTGRLLLSRDGYDIDMKAVIDEAAKRGVVIELNASPYRFDIDWRHLPYAKLRGVTISINPDAHSGAGLTEVFYGVGIARKGWQEAKDILNTRTTDEVEQVFQRRRR